MLVLSRKMYEEIVILTQPAVVLRVVDIREDKVRIGIDAPESIAVHRREVYESKKHGGYPHQYRKTTMDPNDIPGYLPPGTDDKRTGTNPEDDVR